MSFKIVRNYKEINLDRRWKESAKFKSKGQLVNEKGQLVTADYQGHHYRLIAKKERVFSLSERVKRFFLGIVAVISSLDFSLSSPSIKNLFIKEKEKLRFGMSVSVEKQAAITIQKYFRGYLTRKHLLSDRAFEVNSQQAQEIRQQTEAFLLDILKDINNGDFVELPNIVISDPEEKAKSYAQDISALILFIIKSQLKKNQNKQVMNSVDVMKQLELFKDVRALLIEKTNLPEDEARDAVEILLKEIVKKLENHPS